MKHLLRSVLAGATILGAASAQSGWKNLTGQKVPAIHADTWLNLKPGSVEDGQSVQAALKGKVWLIEFFATW